MAIEDVLITKLMSIDEHHLRFEGLLPIARAPARADRLGARCATRRPTRRSRGRSSCSRGARASSTRCRPRRPRRRPGPGSGWSRTWVRPPGGWGSCRVWRPTPSPAGACAGSPRSAPSAASSCPSSSTWIRASSGRPPRARRRRRRRLTRRAHKVEEAADRLGHDELQALRGDVERVREVLAGGDLAQNGTHGVAVYACSPADLLEVVRLPHPIESRAVLDETPWVEPLLRGRRRRGVVRPPGQPQGRADLPRAGDRPDGGRAGRGRHARAAPAGRLVAGALPAVGRAGEADHLRTRSTRCSTHFKRDPFHHLVLGAPEDLASEVEDPCIRTCANGSPAASPSTWRTRAPTRCARPPPEVVEQKVEARERELLDRMAEGVGRGGRGAAGIPDVLAALEQARVEVLLLADGFDAPGARERDREGDHPVRGRRRRAPPRGSRAVRRNRGRAPLLMARALVIVDFQNDFTPPSARSPSPTGTRSPAASTSWPARATSTSWSRRATGIRPTTAPSPRRAVRGPCTACRARRARSCTRRWTVRSSTWSSTRGRSPKRGVLRVPGDEPGRAAARAAGRPPHRRRARDGVLRLPHGHGRAARRLRGDGRLDGDPRHRRASPGTPSGPWRRCAPPARASRRRGRGARHGRAAHADAGPAHPRRARAGGDPDGAARRLRAAHDARRGVGEHPAADRRGPDDLPAARRRPHARAARAPRRRARARRRHGVGLPRGLARPARRARVVDRGPPRAVRARRRGAARGRGRQRDARGRRRRRRAGRRPRPTTPSTSPRRRRATCRPR